MSNRRRATAAAILALSLLLLPSLSFASGHSAWRYSSSVGPLDLLSDWLARAWSLLSGAEPRDDRAWQSAGCGIDPNGLPLVCVPIPGTSSAQTVEPAGTDPAQ